MKVSPQYAGFSQRVLAWLLDLFLFSALLSPLLFLLNNIAITHIHDDTTWMLFRMLRLVLVLAISLTIICQTMVRFGGTPGKVLMGLQVLDAHGQWLRPRQALGRILLSIPAIVSVVGILMMFFDKQRRTFHDRVLNTVVIVKYHDYAEDPMPGDFQ